MAKVKGQTMKNFEDIREDFIEAKLDGMSTAELRELAYDQLQYIYGCEDEDELIDTIYDAGLEHILCCTPWERKTFSLEVQRKLDVFRDLMYEIKSPFTTYKRGKRIEVVVNELINEIDELCEYGDVPTEIANFNGF